MTQGHHLNLQHYHLMRLDSLKNIEYVVTCNMLLILRLEANLFYRYGPQRTLPSRLLSQNKAHQ